jgi:oligoribonuclease
MNDRLVWIDCEMTGLDIERDALIEIACLVTDAQLNLLDEGIDLIIKPPAEALESMPEIVREMHTASGLLAELPGGIAVAEAAELVLGYVRGHVREARKVPLCGNSIATDRWFIARDMPELDAYLHYRMVDVSSIKELARRWWTSGRACRSSGITGRPCSCRSPARTPPPRGRSRRVTPSRVRRRCEHVTRGTPETAILVFSRAMSPRAARVLLWPGRTARRRWWA